MSDKKFSMFDDPSFSQFTQKDWEEWRKNQKKETPPAICVGCLNQLIDGTCEVYSPTEQRTAILARKCSERFD